MHMTIPLKELQAALKAVAPATKDRSPLPILKHVLIQSGSLTCTDLDLRIEHTLSNYEGHMDHDPKLGCTVDYKTLADWVSLAKSDVTLHLHGDQLHVKSGKGKTTLPTLPPEEFPAPNWGEGQTYSFADGILQQVLRKVEFSRAQAEETRAVMTGVLFSFGPNGLTLVGCDGRRLAYQTIPGQHEKNDVVLSGADHILGLSGDLTLSVGQGSWTVQALGTKLGGRVLEDSFPAWDKVCAFETSSVMTVARPELMEALRRVLIFTQDKQSPHLVQFDFADGVLRISGENATVGSGVEELHTGWDGQLRTAFNGRFILEGLGRLDTPMLEWGFQSHDKASRIRVGEWNYVVMPVKVREVAHA